MNDDKIKELFKNDHSAPDKPVNEWSQILNKVEKKKDSFSIYPKIAVSMFVITIAILGISVQQNLQKKYDDQLAEYLFSESYFEDEIELNFYSE